MAVTSLPRASALVLAASTALVSGAALAEPPPTVLLPAAPPDDPNAPPPPSAQPPPPPPSTQPPPGPPPPRDYMPPPPAWGAPPAYGPYDGPPPPPPYVAQPRTYRDGLYVRLGLGLVNHQSKLSYPKVRYPVSTAAGTGNGTLKGAGFGVDAAVGGSVRPGLAIAFEFGGHDVASPTASSGAPRPDALSYSRIGAMADWYPNPKGGFHVQGGAALATTTFEYTRTVYYDLAPGQTVDLAEDPETLHGWAWHAGIGYEWWAARDWSMGILGRVDVAKLKGQGTFGNHELVMVSPGLMFSITLN